MSCHLTPDQPRIRQTRGGLQGLSYLAWKMRASQLKSILQDLRFGDPRHTRCPVPLQV